MTWWKKSPPKRAPAPLGSSQNRRKAALTRRRWIQAAVLSLVFLAIVGAMTKRIRPVTETATTKGFASEDIQADFQFETVDLTATRDKAAAAAAAVPDTYLVEEPLVAERLDAFAARVDALEKAREEVAAAIRDALANSTSDALQADVVERAVRTVAGQVAGAPPFDGAVDSALLVPWLMPAPESIPRRVFATPPATEDDAPAVAPAESPLPATGLEPPEGEAFRFANLERLRSLGRESLEYVLYYGVLDPEDLKSSAAGQEGAERGVVVLRERLLGDMRRSERFARQDAPVTTRAARLLRERIHQMTQTGSAEEADAAGDLTRMQEAAAAVAALSLEPTLRFDPVTTEGQQAAATQEVLESAPVMKEIERNQYIIRAGERWTDQARSDYETMSALTRSRLQRTIAASIAANIVFAGIAVLALLRVLTLLQPERPARIIRDTNLSLLILTVTLVVGRIAYYFEPTGLIVPAAAAAILMAILVNTRTAATVSVLTCFLLSVLYDYSWRLLVVSTAMSLTGVFTIYEVRKRGDMGRAAAKATVVGLLAVLACSLGMDSITAELPRRLLIVGLNGIAVSFLVPGLLPPLEKLFGITTDIQLLEYSDLNNEILSRMAIEVPATYAHSLMLGQLADSACTAIGANGLLARVCAYYHDIGKLRRPEYFTENQQGTNVHDSLAPRMSARAISAHVTEGAKMARQYHLPQPIIDGIFEHHGTFKVGFFLDKARQQQRHDGVREEDFRYPGPKPQSRETAVLMICDAVESAVRSLKNPNEERVRELVDKIITARAADRQFDECGLTLKDLDTIASVLTRQMVTGLHQRIAYPEDTKLPPVDDGSERDTATVAQPAAGDAHS